MNWHATSDCEFATKWETVLILTCYFVSNLAGRCLSMILGHIVYIFDYIFRLLPPPGMEKYFLSHRQTTCMLASHQQSSLWCFQKKLFSEEVR